MREHNKATAYKRGTASRQFEKKQILLWMGAIAPRLSSNWAHQI